MTFSVVRQPVTALRTTRALLLGAVFFVPVTMPAQVPIKRTASGFNLFTVEQDIEVGKMAAAELERTLDAVRTRSLRQFIDNVTSVLGVQISNTPFSFSTTVVSSSRLDAHPLPGGALFISRGLLSLARNEGEVAGVIAHSMAHVILRHGTERTSRAYLARAGIGALGGWGATHRTASHMVGLTGGSGLQAAFLSFDDAEEYEADALGSDLMAKAGYDPVAMAAVFATLRREQKRHAGLSSFFERHPAPSDREYRIRNLANVLGHGRAEVVGGFLASRLRARTTPAAPSTVTIASAGSVEPMPAPVPLNVPRPSSRFVRFNHPDSLLSIEYPENWNVFPSGVAISVAPEGGVVERRHGEPHLAQGMVFNYYAPFENAVERWNRSLEHNYAPFDRSRPRGILEDATDDLVRRILSINPHLTAPDHSANEEALGAARGYSVRLRGKSPVTGEVERVTLFTMLLPDDDVVYLACVTPARFAVSIERACSRMARSLRVNEAAVHRN